MYQCAKCLLDLNVYPALEGADCPNCGYHTNKVQKQTPIQAVSPNAIDQTFHSIKSFLEKIKNIIFNPKVFFSSYSVSIVRPGGLTIALAFAVICLWLSAFFNFIWRAMVGTVLESRLNDLFQIAGDVVTSISGVVTNLDGVRAQFSEFLFGAGMMILTPFTSILQLTGLALLIHAAVRFFIKEDPSRPHSYSATLKILCFATAPWLLCIIPGVGVFLAWVLSFYAAIAGFQVVYRTSAARAAVVVMFPYLMAMGFFMVLLFIFLFLSLNMLTLVT